MNAVIASAEEFSEAGLFPTREQYLVLTAALGDGERALQAYGQWRAMHDLAERFDREVFRLIPLLSQNLRRLGVEDDLSGRLRGAYRMSWVKVHKLAKDTLPIITAFRAAGLGILAIKGAPLGQLYYRNPALRPMSDYDLVISAQQVPRAVQILTEMGYTPWLPINDDVLRYRHAMGFRRADGHEFDLHWHVMFDFCDASADQWFWSGATECELLGHPLQVPDATRTLLLVLVHGVRWNPEPPVRWVADAMYVLRTAAEEINWQELVSFAKQRRVCRRLWLALIYLQQHFDAAVPSEVLNALAANSGGWLERLESRTILRDHQRVYAETFGPVLTELAAFGRYAHGKGPLRFLGELLHYLRFSWNLPRRRNIAGYLGRRAARRCWRLIRAE